MFNPTFSPTAPRSPGRVAGKRSTVEADVNPANITVEQTAPLLMPPWQVSDALWPRRNWVKAAFHADANARRLLYNAGLALQTALTPLTAQTVKAYYTNRLHDPAMIAHALRLMVQREWQLDMADENARGGAPVVTTLGIDQQLIQPVFSLLVTPDSAATRAARDAELDAIAGSLRAIVPKRLVAKTEGGLMPHPRQPQSPKKEQQQPATQPPKQASPQKRVEQSIIPEERVKAAAAELKQVSVAVPAPKAPVYGKDALAVAKGLVFYDYRKTVLTSGNAITVQAVDKFVQTAEMRDTLRSLSDVTKELINRSRDVRFAVSHTPLFADSRDPATAVSSLINKISELSSAKPRIAVVFPLIPDATLTQKVMPAVALSYLEGEKRRCSIFVVVTDDKPLLVPAMKTVLQDIAGNVSANCDMKKIDVKIVTYGFLSAYRFENEEAPALVFLQMLAILQLMPISSMSINARTSDNALQSLLCYVKFPSVLEPPLQDRLFSRPEAGKPVHVFASGVGITEAAGTTMTSLLVAGGDGKQTIFDGHYKRLSTKVVGKEEAAKTKEKEEQKKKKKKKTEKKEK